MKESHLPFCKIIYNNDINAKRGISLGLQCYVSVICAKDYMSHSFSLKKKKKTKERKKEKRREPQLGKIASNGVIVLQNRNIGQKQPPN